MAPMSRGSGHRVSKTINVQSRKKTGTATTKKHRFQSFSQRIANLNIEPVRRAQGRAHAYQQDDSSHFLVAFQEWKDLNLTESFSAFVAKVEPLCHSLPQVLHYEQQIVDLLISYIENGDSLSLEPLLSLVVHFARDMGTRFERHFERVVATVSTLAATHQSLGVIEWSFTCLAWLFKYLSRLLVPDLRPVYKLMAPLLGKAHQKDFVIRFAAEAMSFLIRKAAAGYDKTRKPLENIVKFAFSDLCETPTDQLSQYCIGLSILFSDAMQGIQRGIRPHGDTVLTVILSFLLHTTVEENIKVESVQWTMESVVADVLQHSDADGFEPLFEVIIASTVPNLLRQDEQALVLATRLLFHVAGTRKGSRVKNWRIILKRVLDLMDAAQNSPDSLEAKTLSMMLTNLALVMQYAPLEETVAFRSEIMRKLDSNIWDSLFLGFCTVIANVSSERFREILFPQLQRFITTRWESREIEICFALRKLATDGALHGTNFELPVQIRDTIGTSFKSLASGALLDNEGVEHTSEAQVYSCSSYMDILNAFPRLNAQDFAVHDLLALFNQVSDNRSAYVPKMLLLFCYTKVLRYLTHHLEEREAQMYLWPRMVQHAPEHIHRLVFLESFLNIVQKYRMHSTIDTDAIKLFRDGLVENLASSSHKLRLLSLELLQALSLASDHNEYEALTLALSLEQSPFNLDTARWASLTVRKLLTCFEQAGAGTLTRVALPAYCFGLLHVRLSSVWGDACGALKIMSNTDGCEDLVTGRAISWLKKAPERPTEKVEDENQSQFPVAESPYADPNLLHLERLMSQSLVVCQNAREMAHSEFVKDTAEVAILDASNRSQALSVLKANPLLAERKSRAIVPILLRWASLENVIDDEGQAHQALDSLQNPVLDFDLQQDLAKWSQGDKKQLLSLFGSFVNPKALYRSAEVYSALLALLCHGDIEVQKAALQALFQWNDSSIITYREHLLNLLDDARFRDEVAVFLNVDETDSEIRLEHRQILMPVLLRILYGRILSQSSSSNNRGGQKAKRRAVLTSLARFGDAELGNFLSLALGPLDHLETGVDCIMSASELRSPRKQAGMLRLLGDVFEILANRVQPFATRLINAVLYCTVRSSRHLLGSDAADASMNLETVQISLLKTCRQEGASCLNALFEACTDFEWSPFLPTIMAEIVQPRLAKLPIETAQSVSGLLRLFSTWSKSPSTIKLLFDLDSLVLHKVADCLIEPSAREEVKLFVLKNILAHCMDLLPSGVTHDVHSSPILVEFQTVLEQGLGSVIGQRLSTLLRSNPGKESLERAVQCLIWVAPYVKDDEIMQELLKTALNVLRQPARLATPRTKGQILLLLKTVLSQDEFSAHSESMDELLCILSALFSYFRDNQNRYALVLVFAELTKYDEQGRDVAGLCKDLNAFSSKTLNQPDFDRRLSALNQINEEKYLTLTERQWLPLVHNMLFLMRDNDELSMRSGASLSLRRFIERACNESQDAGPLNNILTEALMPALETGMSEESELVRAEFVSILAELVKNSFASVTDMTSLLGPDDESSFFKNILHIQQHRRMRALRRLASLSTTVSSQNIARFCLPLVENFFPDMEEADQNLGMEALVTMEALAMGLDWQRYRSLLHRTTANATKMTSKFRIRALGAVISCLYKARHHSLRGALTVDNQEETKEAENHTALADSLPNEESLARSIVQPVLSKLMEKLHYKDESTVDLRVLLAISTVKIIMVLSEEHINTKLPAILMDMSNILRSKAQEARDAARKAIAEIAAVIGPVYFGFVIKQLRSTLQKGSQLHVLSYTVHSLLEAVASKFEPGSIDYCSKDLMDIMINDTFGAVGQEKDAEDYVSRMKEVKKKSLSFDSIEVLATITSLNHVSALLNPIQEQLGKPRPKINHVDELLRRVKEGLLRNKSIHNQESLVLCFEVISEAFEQIQPDNTAATRCGCKMAAFGLELLRRVLDKHEEYKTPTRLLGFCPMLLRSLEQNEEEVQIAAMRLMASIIKVPIDHFDTNAKFYVRRARALVDVAPSTNAPVAQAAVRLIAAVLRERPDAQIPKSDFDDSISYLLKKIKPDLQTPGRQGDRDQQVAAFNFLRAVVGRRELVAEVYEVMDVVRDVMINSQEAPVPGLARSVYSRFVLNYYPDEAKGFSKQLEFMVANLQYPHPNGRLSIMEVIMFLLTRRSEAAVQSSLVSFFLPLVVTLSTDSDQQCQDSAALLIQQIFQRADKERRTAFKAQMYKWLNTDADVLWRQAGFRCWTIYLDVHASATKDAASVRDSAQACLRTTAHSASDENGQLLETVLRFMQKTCNKFPIVAFAPESSEAWSTIALCLRNEKQEVRVVAVNLMVLYVTDFIRMSAKDGTTQRFPVKGSAGLELDVSDATFIVRTCMRMLQAEADESIVAEAIQLVAMIGRLSLGAGSDDLLREVLKQSAAVVRVEGDGRPPRAKVASVKLMLALTKLASAESITPVLEDILLPLHNLVDTNIPSATSTEGDFRTVHEELLTQTQDLLDTLQTKMGPSVYLSSMRAVQKAVKERREERRAKRRITAVSDPEKMERLKRKKHEGKKIKRREKNTMAAGRRRGW